MKAYRLGPGLGKTICQMLVGDFFSSNGKRFYLVVKDSRRFGTTTVRILTFEFNDRDFMCNVWNDDEAYYLQEMPKHNPSRRKQ